MDTGTLISLVNILDNRIKSLQTEYDNSPLQGADLEIERGQIRGLTSFRDYLQNAIEGNISAMETSMGM